MGRLAGEPWCALPGGGAGYYSEVRVYPRLVCASVAMFNRAGIRDEHILDRLDRFLVAEKRRPRAVTSCSTAAPDFGTTDLHVE